MSIAITGLLMAACSDDFKDWKAQQTYDQEEAITIPGFSASATAVDLNTSENLVKIITLNGTLPEGSTIEHVRFAKVKKVMRSRLPITLICLPKVICRRW